MKHLTITLCLLLCTAFTSAYAEEQLQTQQVILDCPDCPEMVVIPAGSFVMGSNSGDSDERPMHRVTIAKSFAMSKTEVTQVQWRAVMQDQWRTIGGKDPSFFVGCGNDCPVEQVSWNDIKIFIQKLNAKTRKQYRLPTEAEWEYACRAGGQHQYCGGEDIDSLAIYGASLSTDENLNKTHRVASKQPNAFGLYDMSGNVWEWVEDSYHDNYAGAPSDGDAWQSDGKRRVIRGGSWFNAPKMLTASKRFKEIPVFRSKFTGFRLVRILP